MMRKKKGERGYNGPLRTEESEEVDDGVGDVKIGGVYCWG
jgi:hypothetical protein